MKESSRIFKRVKIVVTYLLVLFALVASVYFIFKAKPSCQDGILNQNEERTDCGGPCFPCPERLEVKDLEVSSVQWAVNEEQKYDVLGVVNNPNDLVGLENFNFRVIFLDEAGGTFFTSNWEKGFILPKEKKELLILSLVPEKAPAGVQIELEKDSFLWQKFSQYDQPEFLVINPRYEKSEELGAYQSLGTLVNKSKVDFETVKVKVILRDEQGKFLGANYQIINTVRSGEQRDFVIFFPQIKGDLASKVEVEPETNVFSSDNFIRLYGNPEKWDE